VLEQVTVYGLLMVMRFTTLDQCNAHAEKLYGADAGECFEMYETVSKPMSMPPERPTIFLKEN
tara:strand:+ start:844 stop:1032 length:189 start_codon:yes stop_codon:yes gene_type:complete